MDKYAGLPSWIQKSKKTLRQTQEWQTFTMKLYDVVHHQMHEMGVSSFHELNPSEKELLLQRGFHALRKTEAYHNLLEVVSDTLDESVSREADKLSKEKIQTKSRLEILQDECGKGVTALLQKWPDSKSSLRQCLNVDTPVELRYVMWKNFLKNAKVKEEYLMLVASNPEKLVSPLDFEISQKCKMLLASDPTLKGISNKSYVYSAMKHVLSYYHCKFGGPNPLIETDFLLAIPVVICMLAAKHMLVKGGPDKNLTKESLGCMMEQFFTFMERRPEYMMSLKGESILQMSLTTGQLIHKRDPELTKTIEDFRVEGKHLTERNLEIALSSLLHPMVRSMFVGYFPIDTVMHMWDIHILGFGHAGYDAVPYLCATIFLLLRNELSTCKSDKEASTVIIKRCRCIGKEQFIHALRQYDFERELKDSLDIADEDYFPVFHPSLKSNLAPWKYWYSEKIIDQAQKERAGRIGSSTSRNLLGDERYDENAALAEMDLQEQASRLRAERDSLAENVEKERRLRVEMQQHADGEIERLRRKLDLIQKKNPQLVSEENTPVPPERQPTPAMTPPEPKVEKPEPKPPTPKPTTPVPDKPPTPKPKEITPETIKAQKVSDDFIKKMMASVTLLAHGDARQRKLLDKATQKDMNKLQIAYDKAKKVVYGKTITEEKLAQLTDDERKEKDAQVQEQTKKILFKIK